MRVEIGWVIEVCFPRGINPLSYIEPRVIEGTDLPTLVGNTRKQRTTMKGPLDRTTPQPRSQERDCEPRRDSIPSPPTSTGIFIQGKGVGFEI